MPKFIGGPFDGREFETRDDVHSFSLPYWPDPPEPIPAGRTSFYVVTYDRGEDAFHYRDSVRGGCSA